MVLSRQLEMPDRILGERVKTGIVPMNGSFTLIQFEEGKVGETNIFSQGYVCH